MGLTATIVFYLLFGAGIATAVFLADEALAPRERGFRVATALVFWPLYVPVLLQRPPASTSVPPPTKSPADKMAAAIAQVEAELDTALKSLDGWAEDVLAREAERVAELRAAWTMQAGRIRELEVLLAQPEFAGGWNAALDDAQANERLRQSRQVREENIRRLQHLRQQMYDDLMGTLAWVRELVTMIHLAKYTGAPASRAEELVRQIAAAVEGLSEVTDWRNQELVA
jgi:hypothetical protein